MRFAGTWYEADPAKLDVELQGYLQSAERVWTSEAKVPPQDLSKRALYAIIAPHAGYIYSGETAAVSYEFASRFKPKRVFLMGPSHYVGFQGVVLSSDAKFETPLGDLPVDRQTVERTFCSIRCLRNRAKSIRKNTHWNCNCRLFESRLVKCRSCLSSSGF